MFLERYSKNQPFLLCPENLLLNDVNVLKHMLPYIVSALTFLRKATTFYLRLMFVFNVYSMI